jgi:hypothetical protein
VLCDLTIGITIGNVMFANSNACFVTYGEVLPLAMSCLSIPMRALWAMVMNYHWQSHVCLFQCVLCYLIIGITIGNVMFAYSNACFVSYGEVLPLAKSCLPIPMRSLWPNGWYYLWQCHVCLFQCVYGEVLPMENSCLPIAMRALLPMDRYYHW